MVKQMWVTDDDTHFDTEAEAVAYDLKREYALRLFKACGDYFTTDQVVTHAEAVRDLLDGYLIKLAELKK